MRKLMNVVLMLFVQKNKIELVNVSGARLLVYLDASQNQLMNIHGLDGCSSLRHLDMSHNRITRVGQSLTVCCVPLGISDINPTLTQGPPWTRS